MEEQAVELPQAPRRSRFLHCEVALLTQHTRKLFCLENCSLNGNSLDLLMIRADQPTLGQLWNETDLDALSLKVAPVAKVSVGGD